ncbi:MAG: ABC transporter ATP-binding protein, partial [Synechococcaceae bacterium WBB_10_009]|nr:ABC transporter ATP-binding protein [Synechococcaceae bacterium WBB_10_009]
MESRPVLQLRDLVVRYPGARAATLSGLNLELARGQRLALVGPSGCGKSTVARAVLQLLPPGSLCRGELRLAGHDPRQLPAAGLQRLRGEAVGLVFQDPMTRLNPLLTIGEHLRDTLAAHRPKEASQALRQRAEALLTRVGIAPARYGSYPHEFSGGMRQRVAIALAMALRPQLVIADEPTTSLCRECGSALLLISHNLALAGQWCDQIAVLEHGQLVEQGPARALLLAPRSALGQRLVARARALEGSRSASPATAAPLLQIANLRCWHRLGGPPWKP